MGKDKLHANMLFIGNLFLRKLLAVKVIGQIVTDLLGLREAENSVPDEHMIEYACQLLEAIGHTLDTHKDTRAMMSQFFGRLAQLKNATNASGRPALTKRIVFQIQDLIDMRHNQWVKKVFRDQA
eukprot:NODE_4997_length_621_cov_158.851590.p2 GENE.NODE_4997_length_621_cov_158.851590~~NODE_4997_length_621_cov_158.851590.p2  ORF type:complete len:125 (+),score=32.23 NODE_4997_length_621_cov_158.851590:3-377(+)